MEFCEMVKKISTRTIQKMSAIRMSLHVGPQYIVPDLTEQQLSGEVITTLGKGSSTHTSRNDLRNRAGGGGTCAGG